MVKDHGYHRYAYEHALVNILYYYTIVLVDTVHVINRLEKLYEDNDVVVVKAPDDKKLVELIVDIIKGKSKPVSWSEFREVLTCLAGEDRLRKVLADLVERGVLVELPDGCFALPGMEYMVDWERARKRRFRRRFSYLERKRGKIAGVQR